MYQLYFAERDTTLYERYPDLNTGNDRILELSKTTAGTRPSVEDSISSNTYNSRIIVDFGKQITALTTAVDNGEIPPIGNNEGSASVYLNLRAASAEDLPYDYTLYAYPVSQSWTSGNGTYGDTPGLTEGASWYYRDSLGIGTYWDTGSAHSSGDQSATETFGGGAWITGSGFEASQSFSNEAPDLRMNVTDIVEKWVKSEIDNYGFLIKRSKADESGSAIFGKIQFFAENTNTIYIPRLEVAWDDVDHSGTSSFSEISSETYVPYFKNIRNEYRETERAKFRIGVRPEFPTKTYQTQSFYITEDRLPTSSYFSIKDAVTEETIIPFDTEATKISCDTKGSYFKLRLNTFLPERHYKIVLKIERDSGDDIQIHDEGFFFKVVR